MDVLDGRVVRLVQGDYARVTVYSDDPVRQAQTWVDQGATLVHVVDLAGAASGGFDRRLGESLAAAGITFQVGGGIRSAEAAGQVLAAGAIRVVMGTAAVWSPEILAETLSLVGDPERLVAAVDVRDGRATGAGWRDLGRRLESVLEGLAIAGVRRVLVTGIGRDGTMTGPDLELVSRVMAGGPFRVQASGGVGSLADLTAVAAIGCEAVIVGRALYEARFTLAEAISTIGTTPAIDP